MSKKTVIVACATGVATSTVICERLKELADSNGIKCHIIQCKVPEISSHVERADFIVTSSKIPKDYGIPHVKATAYLVDVDDEIVDEKIVSLLCS